jgi:hypothetical protein
MPPIPSSFSTHLVEVATRTRLIEHLKQHGVHALFPYIPLHTAPVGEQMGYRAGMLPAIEYCADLAGWRSRPHYRCSAVLLRRLIRPIGCHA